MTQGDTAKAVFFERREAVKNAINVGEWPVVAESEILTWIAYMERLEFELDFRGQQLSRMIDRWEEARKDCLRM